MTRRVLALTLVAQMLFMQLLVAHAHTHADDSPSAGSSRPHVHLDSLSFVAPGSAHACERHPHRHEGERSPIWQAEESFPEDDHDADAVYLPTDPGVARPTTRPRDDGASFGFAPHTSTTALSFPAGPPPLALPPPPSQPDGVPLYLRASRLLI